MRCIRLQISTADVRRIPISYGTLLSAHLCGGAAYADVDRGALCRFQDLSIDDPAQFLKSRLAGGKCTAHMRHVGWIGCCSKRCCWCICADSSPFKVIHLDFFNYLTIISPAFLNGIVVGLNRLLAIRPEPRTTPERPIPREVSCK